MALLLLLVVWISAIPAFAQPRPGQPAPGQPAPNPGQPAPGEPAPRQPAPNPGQPAPGQPAPNPGQPAPGQPAPNPGQPDAGQPDPGQPTPNPGQPTPDPTPDGPVEIPKTDAELARGLTIAKVTVSGNQRIPSEDILVYLTGERVGKDFSPEALHRDVREMWKSLFFEDIQIDLTRRDTECTLRVIVRERASIKSLEWEGNKGLDEDDLTEAISAADVKVGAILSYAAVRAGVQKVRDKYAEEGFFLAEVDFEVTPAKNNQVVLKFTIHEHEQVSVRRITFIGNNSVPEADLREVMITGHSSFFDFGSGGAFRQDAFERDILVINALYYDRGFLGVSVATPRVELTQDRTGIEITIPIVEGPRFKIRSIKVYERDADGKEVEPIGGRRSLREMIRAKQGDWFNRAELSRDIGNIQTLYRDAGYANVEVPLENEVDPDTNEVDLRMAIQRKKLVKFGRIEIHGNTKTRDKVIRREMEIQEGKLFSETGLARSRERIYRLGYFEKVDITPEQGDDDQTININIDIVEKPTGTFQIGAGFSSIESFIATAQIQQANLFGTGLAFSLNASISGLRQQIDFELADPYFLDSKFSGAIHLYDQLRVYDGFSQNSAGGAVTFGYPLVDPEVRLALTYTLENNEISTTTTSTFFGTASAVSVFKKLPLANLFTDGVTSSIRPTITYDSRNNQQFPTKGIYLSGSIEAAPGFLGTENEFYKFTANARFYYPITESIIFRVNSNAGAVVSPDAQGVPIYSRFWLGGIYDLRGFRLRTVGPRLPLRNSLDENASPILNGQPIGGNLMYYQNVEIEFPIIEAVQVRGVVFTDLGNTWNLEQLYCDAAPASPNAVTNPCFHPESLFDVRSSVGFGIRWISPLGPLRFEWGFPLKPLSYEEGSVFEFTIGNFF